MTNAQVFFKGEGSMMNILSLSTIDKKAVNDFFTKHWGCPQMVISSGVFDCDQLPGFCVMKGQEIIGLITYCVTDGECEIISLDSVVEGKGIGSKLMVKVEEKAKAEGCSSIKLVTTNDNVYALSFYQKRGYRLARIIPHAVEKARKLKPTIPYVAENGIPIIDEIILVKGIWCQLVKVRHLLEKDL